MKNLKKTSTSKLVAAFDLELKNILMEDLKVSKNKNQFVTSNHQGQVQTRLTAA
jgi:hypothetical protein